MIYRYDLTGDIARLAGRVPMLCLHGDHDESTPIEIMRWLAEAHRDCTLQVNSGATHALPLEQPTWVRMQIENVLLI